LVFSAVMDSAVFKEIPEEYTDKYTEIINSTVASYASYYGLDTETMAMYMYGVDVATVAEEYAKQELVMQAIANAENLNVSDEELDESIKAEAESYGITVEEYLNGSPKEYFRDSLMMANALDFIVDNAVITYEKAEE